MPHLRLGPHLPIPDARCDPQSDARSGSHLPMPHPRFGPRIPRHRRVPLPLVVVGAALLVAGCGSGSPSTGAGTGAGTSAQSITDPVATAYKFSACMRQHGVADFPDPRVTSSPGQQRIAIHVPPDANTAQFATAQKACRGIMPGPSNGDLAAQAQQQRAQKQGLLSFARCIRRHGIERFPDPDAQGQLSQQMLSAAGVDVHAPSVLAAARACIPASDGQVNAAAIAAAENGGS
jgi:hypothetical protein